MDSQYVEFNQIFRSRLLDTFRFTIHFLNMHQLRWWVAEGTAIGAVRHKGLIPWDDDIDIWMPYEDYRKLKSLRDELALSDYILTDCSDEGNHCSYIKIIDKNTTVYEVEQFQHISGIWVDIFPVYNTNISREEFQLLTDEYNEKWNRVLKSIEKFSIVRMWRLLMNGHIFATWRCLTLPLFHIFKRKYIADFKRFESTIQVTNGKHMICPITYLKNNPKYYPVEYFRYDIELVFEDFVVKAPCGNHEILTQIFGDYMTPPPINRQVSNHAQYYINLKERISVKEARERVNKGITREY